MAAAVEAGWRDIAGREITWRTVGLDYEIAFING
jgi:hypothetical protein